MEKDAKEEEEEKACEYVWERGGGILTSGRGDLRPHSRGSRVSDDFVKRNVSLASRLQPERIYVHTYIHTHGRHTRRTAVDCSCFYSGLNYSRDV